jgi:hypothetical protein
MTFPNQNSLNGTIADLKEILSRSQAENHESKVLLGQIEALVQDIEKKVRPQVASASVVMPPSAASVIV